MESLLKLLLLLFITVCHRVSAATPSSPPPSSAPSYPEEALPTKSGYLTVNSTTGSAIFYAFYEAQTSYNKTPISESPILIWLQGGPGCSSMIGNLREVGPWILNQELTLDANPGSWNQIFGLVFLDNPIGTGFSIARSKQEIPRNQYDIAKQLFIAIQKFIALDKSFKNRPIYLTGESYAGKYIPALGYYIIKMNSQLPKEGRVNLRGVAIGNGLTDPEIQVSTHAINSFYLGLINEKQTALLEKLQMNTVGFIRRGKWSEATDARNRVVDTLTNMTGLATLDDFRKLIPYQNAVVDKFLNNVEVKKALGVKEDKFFERCSNVVGGVLHDDVMKSVKYMVEFLVKNTKVLLYQGQGDLIDGVPSTLAWVKTMRWDGIPGFLEADRKVWRVDGKLAGHVQKWKSFTHVVVLNAGHLVPSDQPVNSQVMIQDWLLERGLFAS
ncbi:Serine carboxypeptidase-like 50 [Abeliophyllum distichum]|uniref:Carboxypeptidase n=1 Tax=Abeliophyllum distichum TaxID=126358 RepID=A0ABD1PMX2_9LAMI